jgi:hypothetical protein
MMEGEEEDGDHHHSHPQLDWPSFLTALKTPPDQRHTHHIDSLFYTLRYVISTNSPATMT